MEDKATKEQLLKQWAKITIERLQNRIRKNKIGHSNALINSLTFDIIAATGGERDKIIFLHNFYGMFVDMGVGRGVSISNRKDYGNDRKLESNKHLGRHRRPKKWYSPTMYAEVIALADLLMVNYAENIQFAVSESIDDKIKMEF